MTQEQALEIMKSGENVFLTGEPGAGKSYTIEQFTAQLRNHGKSYAVTASTGIAATQISGTTIHSWSGIGIKKSLTLSDVYSIANNKWVSPKIRRTSVLIIDEVSMLEASFITDLDKVLKIVNGNKKPFGGIQIVFVGDFFQLPPVTMGADPNFAFESKAWDEANLQICYLTEQHRQEDGVFLDLLRAIRHGDISEEQRKIITDTKKESKSKTQLFTHNADVDRINSNELQKIPDVVFRYKMTSKGNPFAIKTLVKNCLSPEKLELKHGAVVMFTKNNPDAGYFNGTIGTVTRFGNNDRPIISTEEGIEVHAEPQKWEYVDDFGNISWIKQFPLKLAWAITVHKSQGMSLSSANIDLSNAFEYGQGYVAISRVRTLEGLNVIGINDKSFMVHPLVIEKEKEFALKGK